MNLIPIEQASVSAVALLIDILFGIFLGVLSSVIIGTRRGGLLAPAATGPLRAALSAGAWVFYGVYTRDDDGYLKSLLPNWWSPGRAYGDDASEWHGQETGE